MGSSSVHHLFFFENKKLVNLHIYAVAGLMKCTFRKLWRFR